MTGRRFRISLSLASVVAGTCGFAFGAGPAALAATPTVFTYTGAEQSFTVPAGVGAVDVVAVGGKGGPGASVGGAAATVGAVLPVTAGEVLYVEVGANGANSAPAVFGGGGRGGSGGLGMGGSGGGASGVQTISGIGGAALGSRLLVAAGGGGGSGNGPGGFGGAVASAGSAQTAGPGVEPGQPGADSTGGAGGSGAFGGSDGVTGAAGVGGSGGGAGASGSGGGGGGGGWYGGGGGGAGGGNPTGDARGNGAGGGGGSDFLEPSAADPQIGVDSSGTPSVTITPATLASSGAPTITVISSENPAAVGDLPTFGAGLTPTPTCGSISWLIDGAAPAADVPTGLTNGFYTLGPVPGLSVGSHTVTAVYSGCATAAATSGTVIETVSATSTGTPPSITAQVSSAHPKHHGWYRSPVYVSFACTAGSAPINATCPAPVTFSKNEGGQSVKATIGDSAGRTASVTVSHINIDGVAPALRVTGAVTGTTYRHDRHLVCRSADRLSGIASCRVHKHKSTRDGVTTVRWTAKATDVAGNSTSRSGHYFVG